MIASTIAFFSPLFALSLGSFRCQGAHCEPQKPLIFFSSQRHAAVQRHAAKRERPTSKHSSSDK
jgi:hypothetical protein